MQEYKRIDIGKDQIVPVAERMRKAGVYLVMIHAFIDKEGRMDISWDYAVDPAIESYHVVGEMKVPSVGEIYDTAATWPERELNELFGIEFEGLDVSKRLFLPEDMLETQGKGQIMVTPLKELVEKNVKKEEA
ncbi:MAG: NADH-quinone oxidoreductase subunit C [Candidatus Limivicinus sp.]|nr:NADH-quinone oxidoreductase subunit C [Clostridiales bacterium]MCI7137339.1 NADH-quinone oxidoreductase subunit C [Clostridiales bacterium]MDY4486689.1 NADH-quinone oxidoreductase subunit C [Candidatus Limivicinus sp.]MDY6133906.1 NADH-quinone oxidoreductase subunit C [Candidatus Limivicinus sp.]